MLLADKLHRERNPWMAARIDEYLRSGEIYFVAVGALHLVGESYIVELLKQLGYRVTEL